MPDTQNVVEPDVRSEIGAEAGGDQQRHFVSVASSLSGVIL